jgi:hypothetical protein
MLVIIVLLNIVEIIFIVITCFIGLVQSSLFKYNHSMIITSRGDLDECVNTTLYPLMYQLLLNITLINIENYLEVILFNMSNH